jgi:(S)-2-hydroxyglutarate dehydrogenase
MQGTQAVETPSKADVVVIGAGIVGLAVARELLIRRPGSSVVVLEREDDVGFHQTGHNSGVIHAGIYYKPGSLKARLSRQGASELYEYCEEKGIPARRAGKLIVALEDHELPGLEELERRGTANGVPGLRRVRKEEIAEIEPHVTGVAALHSPDTGVVDFQAVARAFAGDVEASGGRVITGVDVSYVRDADGGVVVRHAGGEIRGGSAVVCAGAWSDVQAKRAGDEEDPRILPFRGAWLKIRRDRRDLVNGMVYPVPDPGLPFLGVHFTRGIDDEVLIGPTALLVGARDAYELGTVRRRDVRSTLTWPGTYRMARKWWRTGAREMHHAARRPAMVTDAARYIPDLRLEDVEAGPAGVRAQAVGRDGALIDDFVVTSTRRTLHVRNAPSPAATSSLALARLIVDRAEEDEAAA